MNYKKLIEQLRDENNCDVLDYIDDAATAIETLLAEREAAMKSLLKMQELITDCSARVKRM